MQLAPAANRICLLTVMLAMTLLPGLGCGDSSGPERASVAGAVTLDGTPVEHGSISFIPNGQTVGPTAGAVIKKGRYSTAKATGPVLGSYRVEITAHRPGKMVDVAGIDNAATGPSAAGAVQEMEMYIPVHYNKESTLTATIKSGSNKHDFVLKSTP